MKYLLAAVLILLTWSDSFAASGILVRRSTACTTPANGDELSEGFEGGYEAAGWTETVGTGGTLTENYTLTGTAPAGSCLVGLYSAAIAGASNMTYATWDAGAPISRAGSLDITGSIRVNSSTLPANDDALTVLHWSNYSTSDAAGLAMVKLIDDNGTLMIKAQGAGNSAEVAITTGIWYSFVLHLDGTAASSYFQIDAGTTCDAASECTFARFDSADGQYLHTGPGYQLDTDEAAAIEWGGIWVNTP